MSLGIETYILGPLTESFKDGSGGKIDLSSHCPLKGALAFQLLGVDEGAAGYDTDEVAATDDVAAAWRDSSLPCRRSTNSSALLPKSSVIESKVLFQGTLVIERMMTWLSRSSVASDILWSLAVVRCVAGPTYMCGVRSPSSLQPSCEVTRRKLSTLINSLWVRFRTFVDLK